MSNVAHEGLLTGEALTPGPGQMEGQPRTELTKLTGESVVVEGSYAGKRTPNRRWLLGVNGGT